MIDDSWRVKMLYAAEVVDAWRVMPRLMLVTVGAFVYQITFYLLDWYTALPMNERSLEASGLAAVVFTAIVGFGTQFLNAYVNSGRKWNGSATHSE